VAHRAFSQPGPWRHAAVARLARTLGRTERKFQTASCLVNFYPPASAQVEKSARKGRSQIRCALSNTVICERCEFSRRNLEELARGASRRALRCIVSQLSRPRTAIGKPSADCRLPLSANGKCINALATVEPKISASSRSRFRAQGRFHFPSASQHA
jgi:hypothetical protein